jgi:hypothetical protein
MSCYNTESWQQKTKNEILEVIKSMGIDRMPTRSEIKRVTGNESLTNRIMKSGGFKEWSQKLNKSLKECETNFGNRYEELTKFRLGTWFKDVKRTSVRFPYDIIVNDKVKIDVKASRLFKGENGEFYTFNLGSKYPKCDFYIAYCIGNNDVIQKVLVIPSFIMAGKSQLSVGINSIYDKYRERWDLIEKFESAFKDIL